ncbi:MAG: hypothetical protein JO262_21230 [Solirubrobacterales bacterium]|nr:hypothetical protein [Solirubrobacterales bacterium]MBV9944661.1 hypothetical protein [Solirubrobacterales bacterium]
MRDPSKDEYLELEQRLMAAESELEAEIAADKKAFGDVIEARREQARSAIRRSQPKDRG